MMGRRQHTIARALERVHDQPRLEPARIAAEAKAYQYR